MVSIPLGKTDWDRQIADEPSINIKNRYFEANPLNTETQSALLSRPGLKKWLDVGTGPITQMYSQPGAFDDALFVSSGEDLHKVTKDEVVTLLGPGIFPQGAATTPQMAATGPFGETPEYLFCADGGVLWCYVEDGFARNTLTFLGQPANGDDVRVGDYYYNFVTSGVDSGTPNGSSGNPWNVLIGANLGFTVRNFYNALNNTGESGVDYSTDLEANELILGYSYTGTTVAVRAIDPGAAGNILATTESSSQLVWENVGTLEDGGTPLVFQIPTPDDVGIVAVAYIASYIVVVPAQGQGINGRFYWINPGETVINPLNFATAERSPDAILDCRVMGDQIWFFGQNSSEVWYPSGSPDSAFARLQGKIFDHGVVQGTALQVGDAIMVVDANGVVYKVAGGLERVSNNSVEERIRNATRETALGNI